MVLLLIQFSVLIRQQSGDGSAKVPVARAT